MVSQLTAASDAFVQRAEMIRQRVLQHPDEAISYAAAHVPIYVLHQPTPEQRVAGGCVNCLYLGLWTNHWNGFPKSEHGLIFIYENGIQQMASRFAKSLDDQIEETIVHELEHALQRNHVLQSMQQERAAAEAITQVRAQYQKMIDGIEYAPQPCGRCPGSGS